MRKGSLLVWNQQLVHGARPNKSANFRIAQFVRGFRRGEMTPARANARAKALRRELQKGGVSTLNPISRHVFGIESTLYSPSPGRERNPARLNKRRGSIWPPPAGSNSSSPQSEGNSSRASPTHVMLSRAWRRGWQVLEYL